MLFTGDTLFSLYTEALKAKNDNEIKKNWWKNRSTYCTRRSTTKIARDLARNCDAFLPVKLSLIAAQFALVEFYLYRKLIGMR